MRTLSQVSWPQRIQSKSLTFKCARTVSWQGWHKIFQYNSRGKPVLQTPRGQTTSGTALKLLLKTVLLHRGIKWGISLASKKAGFKRLSDQNNAHIREVCQLPGAWPISTCHLYSFGVKIRHCAVLRWVCKSGTKHFVSLVSLWLHLMSTSWHPTVLDMSYIDVFIL